MAFQLRQISRHAQATITKRTRYVNVFDKVFEKSSYNFDFSENRFFVDCLLVKDNFKYIENCIIGGREYACHDPPSTLPLARVVNKM